MKIVQTAVSRPITTLMVFTAVILMGLASVYLLKLDVFPDIEMPAMTVVTIYPGASAEEVEQQVTTHLEDELSSVSNMKSLKSQSKEHVSFVKLEFNWSTDLTEAANDVRDRIDLLKPKLPDAAEDPRIIKVNSSMMPLLIYGVEAEENFNALNKIIEDKVTNKLKSVKGVGHMLVLGQPEREIKIEVDPYKLKSYNVSVAQIANLIKAENISVPSGNVKIGKSDIALRVPGEFDRVDQIGQVIIRNFNGKLIRIADVATVEDGFKEKDEKIYASRKKAVAIMIQKQSGENTLEVVESVRREMKKINKTLPSGVKVTELLDASHLITDSIDNLSSTIAYAALFVVLVVFFFLREWRSSLIIIMTIPVSIISAFSFMYISGYTINIFSQMALAITIGMVVDNAIVVLENISKHIENGERPREAAIFGTSEMGTAITASTMTTIAVFLPLVFMGGLVGILFEQLALIATVTLIVSLITAIALTPTLSAKILKPVREQKPKTSSLYKLSESMFIAVEKLYNILLKWAVGHRKLVIFLSVFILGASLWLAGRTGSDYIPEFDQGDIKGTFELEIGASVEETERVAKIVENIFMEEIPEGGLKSIYAVVGQTESGLMSVMGFKEGNNIATVSCKLVASDFRDYSSKEVADRIAARVDSIPAIIKHKVSGGSLLSAVMLGNAAPVQIELTGDDFTGLNKAAYDIDAKLKDMPWLRTVSNTVDDGKPELQIKIDRDKAQHLGLNTAMIAMAVRQSVYGSKAGDFSEANEEYKIRVRYSPEYRNSLEHLSNIMISSLRGEQIPLSAVATIEEGHGQIEIKHEHQQRVVYVQAELNNSSLGEAVEKTRTVIDEMELPEGVSYTFAGQFKDQQDSFSNLYLLFVVGIILVYMIMASQFESLKHPFIIMFCIPLSVIGVIWAFLLTGTTLSVISFIGLIMLLGIVVNNGIVLVDYTNLLKARGNNLYDAVIKAGNSRLRPVLMTALTTICGMIPMAISSGSGSEMWAPLGITVIGGLIFSTLLTLLLIPVIYVSMDRDKKQMKEIR